MFHCFFPARAHNTPIYATLGSQGNTYKNMKVFRVWRVALDQVSDCLDAKEAAVAIEAGVGVVPRGRHACGVTTACNFPAWRRNCAMQTHTFFPVIVVLSSAGPKKDNM